MTSDRISAKRRLAVTLAAVVVAVPACGSEDGATDDAAPADFWKSAPASESVGIPPLTSLEMLAQQDMIRGTIVDVVLNEDAHAAAVADGRLTPEEEQTVRYLAGVVRVDELIRGSLPAGHEHEVMVAIAWPRGTDGGFLPLDEARAVATAAAPAIWVLFSGRPEKPGWYGAEVVFVEEAGRVTTPREPGLTDALDLERFASLEELATALRALPEPTG